MSKEKNIVCTGSSTNSSFRNPLGSLIPADQEETTGFQLKCVEEKKGAERYKDGSESKWRAVAIASEI